MAEFQVSVDAAAGVEKKEFPPLDEITQELDDLIAMANEGKAFDENRSKSKPMCFFLIPFIHDPSSLHPFNWTSLSSPMPTYRHLQNGLFARATGKASRLYSANV